MLKVILRFEPSMKYWLIDGELKMKSYFYLPILSLALLCTNAHSSEVKPIPKAFHGKWVSIIGSQSTAAKVKRACTVGDGSDFHEITIKPKSIFKYSTSEEISGSSTSRILSYSKYSSTHIKGKQRSKLVADGAEETEVMNFEYVIKSGKLHFVSPYDTIVFSKCK